MKFELKNWTAATIQRLFRQGTLGTPEARAQWHATLAVVMRGVVQDHARAVWPGRHRTALRLGGQKTFFLERGIQRIAAESTETRARVVITGTAATALARVDGPVTITPQGGKKWLTIPATGAAYGHRAGEFANLRVLFFGKGKIALGYGPAKKEQGPRKVVYWLKKRVTLPQDRTLLPSDETLAAAVELAGAEFLAARMNGGLP